MAFDFLRKKGKTNNNAAQIQKNPSQQPATSDWDARKKIVETTAYKTVIHSVHDDNHSNTI